MDQLDSNMDGSDILEVENNSSQSVDRDIVVIDISQDSPVQTSDEEESESDEEESDSDEEERSENQARNSSEEMMSDHDRRKQMIKEYKTFCKMMKANLSKKLKTNDDPAKKISQKLIRYYIKNNPSVISKTETSASSNTSVAPSVDCQPSTQELSIPQSQSFEVEVCGDSVKGLAILQREGSSRVDEENTIGNEQNDITVADSEMPQDTSSVYDVSTCSKKNDNQSGKLSGLEQSLKYINVCDDKSKCYYSDISDEDNEKAMCSSRRHIVEKCSNKYSENSFVVVPENVSQNRNYETYKPIANNIPDVNINNIGNRADYRANSRIHELKINENTRNNIAKVPCENVYPFQRTLNIFEVSSLNSNVPNVPYLNSERLRHQTINNEEYYHRNFDMGVPPLALNHRNSQFDSGLLVDNENAHVKKSVQNGFAMDLSKVSSKPIHLNEQLTTKQCSQESEHNQSENAEQSILRECINDRYPRVSSSMRKALSINRMLQIRKRLLGHVDVNDGILSRTNENIRHHNFQHASSGHYNNERQPLDTTTMPNTRMNYLNLFSSRRHVSSHVPLSIADRIAPSFLADSNVQCEQPISYRKIEDDKENILRMPRFQLNLSEERSRTKNNERTSNRTAELPQAIQRDLEARGNEANQPLSRNNINFSIDNILNKSNYYNVMNNRNKRN